MINNTAQHFDRTLLQEMKFFLARAFPMVISLGTEPIKHFFDRLFLAQYKAGEGDIYLSAGLSSGITVFAVIMFFNALVGYSNTLVAQHYGAKKSDQCGKIVNQAILFSICMIPLLVSIGAFGMEPIFSLFKHDARQFMLEVQYGSILLYGGVFVLLASAINGFFMGVGNTKIVMFASIVSTVINIPLNYIFIYGKLGVPELGMRGAALATVLGSVVHVIIVLLYYRSNYYHHTFRTRVPLFKIDMGYMKKLIKYGLPSGIDSCISVGVFSFFILSMNSYGPIVGSAVSIAINWEAMVFVPLLGASFATTGIIGQYMGNKDIKSTMRVFWIAYVSMVFYVLLAIVLFLSLPHVLIGIFTDKINNSEEVFRLGTTMLYLVPVYLLFDGTTLMINGVLKGSGDTKGAMVVFIIVDILFAAVSFIFIFTQRVSPITAWWFFVGFAICLAIGSAIRLRQKKWQHIELVDQAL